MKGLTGIALLYFTVGAIGAVHAQTMAGTVGTSPSAGVTRATGTGSGSAQEMASSSLSSSDRKFFRVAAMGGMSEVADGEAADRQGSDSQVKQFGQRMVTDHGKINDELKDLAQKQGVTLPIGPNSKQESALSRLKEKQGAAFDRTYAKMEVKDHKMTIALFRKAAKSNDSDLAMFAQQTLPILQHHLEMAKALKDG